MDADKVLPPVALMRLILGGCASLAVRTMVSLNLADHLARGARGVNELAEAADVDVGALRRLLAVLAALGLCERIDGPATVALTPMGSLLRSDSPGPFKNLTSVMTAPWITRAWEALPEAIRTGETVFDDVHGMGFWEFLAANPDEAAVFNAGMTGGAEQRAAAILEVCDLTGVQTTIDIGGGQGRLVATLLAETPGMRGIVVDRAEVVAGAGSVLASAGVIDRCEVVAADFFVDVPSGGDVYVLAQILHDWADDEALAILRVCAAAMAPGARLIVVEQVLPSTDAVDLIPVLTDINMLVLVGGQERNGAEYSALLEEAGFSGTVVLPTRARWTVVEATRR
jgi:hypothetical protein